MSEDDTIVLRPRRRWLAILPAAVLLAFGAAGFLLLGRTPPSPVPQTAAGEILQVADEATIHAHMPDTLTFFRFVLNPAIVVLDFPDLGSQGRMLNRVAAWAEKDGPPRDRLLSDTELDSAIRASASTPETYYFGHDYRGADLLRFFTLADRDHVALQPEENRLRRLLKQANAEPPGLGALLSLSRAGRMGVDAADRAVILHHELSHGEYFTNAGYADFVASVWQTMLTDQERGLFRSYLGGEGYDPGLEDLMMNEMQAYLMHTPDARFFNEKLLGIPAPRLAAIRAAFRAGMPPGWLRGTMDDLAWTRPRNTSQPRRPRPRRHCRVLSSAALAARLPPRRRMSSIAA